MNGINNEGGNNIWASITDTVSKTAGAVSDAYVSITKAKMANRAEIARLSASSSTPSGQPSGYTPNLLPQWLSNLTRPEGDVKPSSDGQAGAQLMQGGILTWLLIALVVLIGLRAVAR